MNKTALLSVMLLVIPSVCFSNNGMPDKSQTYAKGISYKYPKKYSDWQNAFFGGNGKTGTIVFGNPLSETIIFTSRDFNFPKPEPRSFAKVPKDTVVKISSLCAEGKFREANDLAVRSSEWKDGGEGGRHPGFMLKIGMPQSGKIENYVRQCDYSTGEISVNWTDDAGKWERKSFVSRDNDMTVIRLSNQSRKIDCAVSLSLPEEAHFPDGMKTVNHTLSDKSIGITVCYPVPMNRSGFIGLLDASADNGNIVIRNDTLFVDGASELTLVVKCGIFRDADPHLAEALAEMRSIGKDYNSLLERHQLIHQTIFDRVTVDFGADDVSRNLPNETLLQIQKESEDPVAALLERLFYAGRYHLLSSGNEITPPDLLGIWTGDCKVGWGGYYHLDSNLNLQISSGNVCDMPEIMEGYFNLNEMWAKDFERNANDLLGCRGLLACGNSPGLSSGLMASINDYYPYHYATGEEGWLLYPFWEYYLVNHDETFLRKRLYPLLVKMGEFYEDFLRFRNKDGRYILAGSVSPENQPSGLNVSLVNNSAFDVSGARWSLSTLVKVCDILNERQGQGGDREKWQKILSQLPEYLINKDGAIAEWGWPGLEDRYHHRHSSHLLMVSPFREISFTNKSNLFQAALKSLEKRDAYDYENAGHGYLQAALMAAALGNKESFKSKMNNLLRRDFFFDGLVSAHYPDFGVFCTDVCNSLPALITEMLIGSDEKGIWLLPVLVNGLPKGSVSGIKTRCGVTVEHLEWDKKRGVVKARLRSLTPQTISIAVGEGELRHIKLTSAPFDFESKI